MTAKTAKYTAIKYSRYSPFEPCCVTSKATTGPLIILAFPFNPKYKTINQRGTPNNDDPSTFVHAFFLSLKDEYSTSTLT